MSKILVGYIVDIDEGALPTPSSVLKHKNHTLYTDTEIDVAGYRVFNTESFELESLSLDEAYRTVQNCMWQTKIYIKNFIDDSGKFVRVSAKDRRMSYVQNYPLFNTDGLLDNTYRFLRIRIYLSYSLEVDLVTGDFNFYYLDLDIIHGLDYCGDYYEVIVSTEIEFNNEYLHKCSETVYMFNKACIVTEVSEDTVVQNGTEKVAIKLNNYSEEIHSIVMPPSITKVDFSIYFNSSFKLRLSLIKMYVSHINCDIIFDGLIRELIHSDKIDSLDEKIKAFRDELGIIIEFY